MGNNEKQRELKQENFFIGIILVFFYNYDLGKKSCQIKQHHLNFLN